MRQRRQASREPAAARQPSPATSLWSQPGYRPFVLAATLGRAGDEMLPVTVVLLVLERTGRPALASAVVAAANLPSVLTGPLLGAWLDRTGRRRLALAANQAAFAASSLLLLAAAGRAPAWTLLALGALAGAGAPLLTGGMTSMLPLLVPRGLLPRANAYEAASFNAAAVGGPALAGAAASLAGPAAAVALQAALAGASLLAAARLPELPAGGSAGSQRASQALASGLLLLAREPALRGVTAATTVYLGAQGLLPLALPLLCERLGAGRAAAGYLWACVEAGAIAGAVLQARVGAGWAPERVVLAGIGLVAAGTAAWALAPSFPALLALAVPTGVLAGPVLAATFAVRQRHTPPELRAQVFTTAASLKVGAYALGAALAGPAVAAAGPGGAAAVSGAVQLAAMLAGLALLRVPGGGGGRGRAAAPPPGPGAPTAAAP